MDTFLAVAPPGLEGVVAGELAALGLAKPRRYIKEGERQEAAEFQGGVEALASACRMLRCAERVQIRLGRFQAASFAELESQATRVPWREYLPAGRPVAVKADCRASKLYHEKAVAERVARAAGGRLTREPGAPLLLVRLEKDVCAIELDCSGDLSRRGYRQALAKAPLRETLAAGLLLASGWDGKSPLLDPFCGSGTIVIEAALLALGRGPNEKRRFPFQDFPRFAGAAPRAQVKSEGQAPVIAASDRDAGAIEAARANAARAGVEALIDFRQAAVSAAEPPAGRGWVVTNPPYGLRVAGSDVRDLYAQFGKFLRARCAGWRADMICPNAVLARATGLPFTAGLSTKNGGLDVRFVSASC